MYDVRQGTCLPLHIWKSRCVGRRARGFDKSDLVLTIIYSHPWCFPRLGFCYRKYLKVTGESAAGSRRLLSIGGHMVFHFLVDSNQIPTMTAAADANIKPCSLCHIFAFGSLFSGNFSQLIHIVIVGCSLPQVVFSTHCMVVWLSCCSKFSTLATFSKQFIDWFPIISLPFYLFQFTTVATRQSANLETPPIKLRDQRAPGMPGLSMDLNANGKSMIIASSANIGRMPLGRTTRTFLCA